MRVSIRPTRGSRSHPTVIHLSLIVIMLIGVTPTYARGGDSSAPLSHGTATAIAQTATHDRWFESDDFVVGSYGGSDGFHLFVARERARWGWKPLATLLPGGDTDGEWTGYHCVTGSGRYVVAVTAPERLSDVPWVRDRGAWAYSIEIATGRVQPLMGGVALKYFNPGCGRDDVVTLTRHLGTDQQATEVTVVDAHSGSIERRFGVSGQLASPVSVDGAVIAARGSSIQRISDSVEHLATLPGQPYSLRARSGGVDFLVAGADDASAWRYENGSTRRIGSGVLGRLKLFAGADGRNVAVGLDQVAGDVDLRLVDDVTALPAIAASRSGRILLSSPPKSISGEPFQIVRADSGAVLPVSFPTESAPPTTTLPPVLPDTSLPAERFMVVELPTVLDDDADQTNSSSVTYTSLNNADDEADGAATPAKCAVPRNHNRRQVPQPNAAQVNWAIQMADRNLLTGSNQRPSNYLNMGLAAYSPSNDFLRRQLRGTASSATPIPPSVIQATFAQESAWRQASFRVLPGLSGNPLVSDYYGAAGDINNIDYANADCGYGLGQVTTPMTKAATAYSANGKTKVAADYAENTAAAIQFLVDKWNQLYDAGITLNNGDPTYLENWYFALWAYNTGFHANTGTGPWGLGWTNNPMNSDYPPDRLPFLRTTYADAEHPADWPYQERVFGWMETPLLDYTGEPAYSRPLYGSSQPPVNPVLDIPQRTTFCTVSNECDVNYHDPTGGDADFCTRADRKCWWHEPVTFVTDCANDCAESVFTVSPTSSEPAGDGNHPPACTSSLPDRAIIVDDLPDPSFNVEGCGTPSWQTSGTFEMELGRDSLSGDRLGIIDWHQLGAGFGGHTWFTKNRSSASDTPHINKGTWTPHGLQTGLYTISAHIPSSGASTRYARYRINLGDGTQESRIVDQHLHRNEWVSLGSFVLQPGASVSLTNLTSEGTPGVTNVAFDAMAFVRLSIDGEVVTKKIDNVGIFDSYQRLDTDGNPFNPASRHPFHTMETIYRWAKDLTAPVTGAPRCLNSTGGSLSSACAGDATWMAFKRWERSVNAAGDGSGAAWGAEALTETQADWLGFSSRRLGSRLASGELASPELYKVHQRLRIEFVVNNGRINQGSVSLTGVQRAGDTHFAGFIGDIMRAYRDDYGISLPDLRYSSSDLRVWNHAVTEADPLTTGVVPGQAYMDKKSATRISDTCVRVRAVGGGVIGYRPMVAKEYVRAEADAWRARVESVVTAGRAPNSLLRWAEEIDEMYFNEFVWFQGEPFDPNDGSGYYIAPPIWTHVDANVCANGTVRPHAVTVADISWMPDLYTFVDNVAVRQDGSSAVCSPTSRSCAAAFGDFSRFAHLPSAGDDPWNNCDWSDPSKPRRNGNPWDQNSFAAADVIPTRVKYCDDTSWTEH